MPAASDVLCDASVVLKWFHSEGEEEVEASRALLDLQRSHGVALSVLDLTAYEVANALLRGAGLATDKVSAVLDALEVICPRLTLTPAEMNEAAVLAESYHLTMYDAAYAAAARARHAELATLDRSLLESGLGRRPSEFLLDRGKALIE
jgi:predicted nucleic acid-binding protein